MLHWLVLTLLMMGLVSVHGLAAEDNNLDTLAAQLPKLSDALGTEHYFYNQLNSQEKVIYQLMTEATWDDPVVSVSGVGDYSDEQLAEMAYRALAAMMADDPEQRLYWQRSGTYCLEGDTFTFTLNKFPHASEYKLQKAKARIEEIAEIVGMEGDRYSRLRDLLDWMEGKMEYDWDFLTGTALEDYDDSAYGCLLYQIAVCGGFSDTVKLLCDQLEIPCIIICSDTSDFGNGHSWNYVQMEDGKWYAIDASSISEGRPLMGSQSQRYENVSYHGKKSLYTGYDYMEFQFPELAEQEYVYDGTYRAEYHDAKSHFTEPNPTFVYEVNPDGVSCTVTDYEGKQSGDLTVPESIDGYTVTAIGEGAFFRCTGFNGKLTIPDTVREIGAAAFFHCEDLTGALRLPTAIESIMPWAFEFCEGFTGELVFPASIQTVGRDAFSYCTGFTGDLTIPAGVSMDVTAIGYCKGLNGTLYLPDDFTLEDGFAIFTKFRAVSVSASNPQYTTLDGVLYSKDQKTLLLCPSGKTGTVTIPEGTEVIANAAFYTCQALSGDLTIPNTVTVIGDHAFRESGFNGTLTIPDSVVSIGESAFYSTSFVGDLVIPDSVETIGSGAFMDIPFQGTLTLSNRLTAIAPDTFAYSDFTGDLVIPDGVTTIGDYAFMGCGFGGELYLPDSLEYIGVQALGGKNSSYTSMEFSNSVNLKNRDIELAENAFQWTKFHRFSCNCNSGKTSVKMPTDVVGEEILRTTCNHCGGSQIEKIPFSDVRANEYYAPAVCWAVDHTITAGTSETAFSPEDPCTRAQVVAFLWRTAGYPEPKQQKNPFVDVSGDAYYYKAVLWAVENKIVYGTSNTTFSPDEPCTRGQVAAFLWRAMGEQAPKTDSNPFRDVRAAEYYYVAVRWAAENKIVYGTSTTAFSPNESCTRGQIVTFLYRAYADS